MHYEINVSENGQHLFATHERSLTTLGRVKKLYKRLKAAFPEAEGFAITVTRYETIGYGVSEIELV